MENTNGSISSGKWIQVEENSTYKVTEGIVLDFDEQANPETVTEDASKGHLLMTPFVSGQIT